MRDKTGLHDDKEILSYIVVEAPSRKLGKYNLVDSLAFVIFKHTISCYKLKSKKKIIENHMIFNSCISCYPNFLDPFIVPGSSMMSQRFPVSYKINFFKFASQPWALKD